MPIQQPPWGVLTAPYGEQGVQVTMASAICDHSPGRSLVFEVLLASKLVQWRNDLILYLFDAWTFKSAFAEDFLHLSKVSKGGCKK